VTAHIPGRTWLNSYTAGFSNAQALVIEPTEVGERFVGLWLSINNDGPAIQLTPKQCDEIAHTLMERARLLDPGPVDAEIVELDQ
jgi:hypothetical protein